METNEIATNLDIAIAQLMESEHEILVRGLSELNLNAHLRDFLILLFEQYTVDPEYSGDILKPNDRKALDIARSRMKEIGIEPSETDNYKLTPDIIIHRRNTNGDNLVVIEIKKDSSPKKRKEFDLLKLEHMTIDYSGNHYNYQLGVALVLGTVKNAGTYNLIYFQNGIPVERSKLR